MILLFAQKTLKVSVKDKNNEKLAEKYGDFGFGGWLPGSLHILVTSFFVFWLSRTTKIIFYVCLLTHFARQDRQNGNLKNKQNHATKVTKIQKNEGTKMT